MENEKNKELITTSEEKCPRCGSTNIEKKSSSSVGTIQNEFETISPKEWLFICRCRECGKEFRWIKLKN